jgi:hypothetical protein
MRIVASSLIAAVLLLQAYGAVSAQVPKPQSNGAIRFQPPPAPKPSPTIQLAAPAIPAALDLIVRTDSHAAPAPKIQGPVSVQGPASGSAAAAAFVAALPIRPTNLPGLAAPPRPARVPPAEIRELATLSEPPVSNPPPSRSTEAAPIVPLSSAAAAAAPNAFDLVEPTANTGDSTSLNLGNVAGIALGAIALVVALGSVVLSRRARP